MKHMVIIVNYKINMIVYLLVKSKISTLEAKHAQYRKNTIVLINLIMDLFYH